MTQSHDEFLWRRAAELLQIEKLLEGEPQEVSGNYDRATRSCPLFADFGAGDMRALGVALPASQVEAGIRLLAASAGKTIERDAPFVNLILPQRRPVLSGAPPGIRWPDVFDSPALASGEAA